MTTTLGVLHLELHVPGAMGLKDKRRALKSFKDRLANGFNVSVAEVDALDSHRRAVLAVAMVGNDRAYVEGAIQRIVNAASNDRNMTLADWDIEWI